MKNLLESALGDVYAQLRRDYPQYCACAQCQADVMAMALNQLRPRYTGGTDQGRALAMLDLQRSGTRASLAVTLLEAMRRVDANPNHDAGRATGD
jgi:competence protein ComFB